MNNETDSPQSGIAAIDGWYASVSRMMRMLANHRHPHAQAIILAVYRPDTPAHNWKEVWDGYLASKLEKFQDDPCGWVLTLDSGNLQRLIKLSEGY